MLFGNILGFISVKQHITACLLAVYMCTRVKKKMLFLPLQKLVSLKISVYDITHPVERFPLTESRMLKYDVCRHVRD